jgi:hypothetical protein
MKMPAFYIACVFQEDDEPPYDSETCRLSFESLMMILKTKLLEGICVQELESGIILIHEVPA